MQLKPADSLIHSKINGLNIQGAIAVWERNFVHVEQLFNYGPAVRRVMYTTNAIESVNSSFRKVTKRGSFPNDEAVMKVFYLRILELEKKKTERKGSRS